MIPDHMITTIDNGAIFTVCKNEQSMLNQGKASKLVCSILTPFHRFNQNQHTCSWQPTTTSCRISREQLLRAHTNVYSLFKYDLLYQEEKSFRKTDSRHIALDAFVAFVACDWSPAGNTRCFSAWAFVAHTQRWMSTRKQRRWGSRQIRLVEGPLRRSPPDTCLTSARLHSSGCTAGEVEQASVAICHN